VKTNVAHAPSPQSLRLAELEQKTAELERELYDARESLARSSGAWEAPLGHSPELGQLALDEPGYGYGYADSASLLGVAPGPAEGYAGDRRGDADLDGADERTAVLINRGRASAGPKRLPVTARVGLGVAAVMGLILGVVVLARPGPAPSWPAGVAKVQAETGKACLNPDVSSEPGQVNFACGKTTRQMLWVFALLTSHNDPDFAQPKTGRVGLEPITPAQGGVVAWSLNLHHPYDPTNPIDSLEVAARAMNNIIGGATATSTLGNPVVQPGLESHAANCLRYTGSAKLTSHKGYPALCARPVSSAAGQAALVADVYQRWVVGADPKSAQNAAILFENARNPGSSQVQPILKALPNAHR
jgi:hypothetical protein